MDKIKCMRCGTENNVDYKFCLNCGAPLPKFYNTSYKENPSAAPTEPSCATEVLNFDGASATEMTAYVGKNSNKILPKMYNMQKFNQRVSFCFPVFILGLLFGFFGIFMWCFYRKMKKLGIISLALGLALTLSDLIINLGATTQLISGWAQVFKDFIFQSSDISPNFSTAALENLTAQYNASYVGVFSFLNQYVGGVICPVLMGMFGLHFYKNQAISDIKKIKETVPSEYLLGSIAEKGGTSGGLLFIPIVFYLLPFIISFVILLISL